MDGLSNRKTTLSKNEWLMMHVLWQAPTSLAVSEIVELMKDQVDWSYPTYTTQLDRLVKSGYVSFEKRGRSRFYYPAVDMHTCVQRENASIRDRMTPAASSELVLAMLQGSEQISHEDAERLRRIIDELEVTDNE